MFGKELNALNVEIIEATKQVEAETESLKRLLTIEKDSNSVLHARISLLEQKNKTYKELFEGNCVCERLINENTEAKKAKGIIKKILCAYKEGMIRVDRTPCLTTQIEALAVDEMFANAKEFIEKDGAK